MRFFAFVGAMATARPIIALHFTDSISRRSHFAWLSKEGLDLVGLEADELRLLGRKYQGKQFPKPVELPPLNSKTARIILVRHGRTPSNKLHVCSGHASGPVDDSLDHVGRFQVHEK